MTGQPADPDGQHVLFAKASVPPGPPLTDVWRQFVQSPAFHQYGRNADI